MRKCEWCSSLFDGSYWYHKGEAGSPPRGVYCSPKCELEARAGGHEGSPHALEKAIDVATTAAVVGGRLWQAGSWIARKVRGLIERSPVLMEFFTRFGQWYMQKFKWLRRPGTPQPYYKMLLEVVMWTWGGFFYIPIYYFVSHKSQEH